MKLTTLATALAVSVALVGTLAAAPQGDKAGKAKSDSSAPKSDKAGKKAASVDVPDAAKQAIMKAHPNATIVSATTTGTGADMVYAVRINTGEAGKAGMQTVRVHADGTMVAAPMKGAAKGKKKDK